MRLLFSLQYGEKGLQDGPFQEKNRTHVLYMALNVLEYLQLHWRSCGWGVYRWITKRCIKNTTLNGAKMNFRELHHKE